MPFDRDAQRATAVASGIVFLVVLLAIAFAVPNPTDFQYTVFRIVLALAAAAFAATIPGFIHVDMPNLARASGAIAVFVIVYFFSPAALVSGSPKGSPPSSSPHIGPASLVPFSGDTKLPGVQARFVGNVGGGNGELNIELKTIEMSFPKAAPDGGGRYIPYYRVLLAEGDERSWKTAYQSDKQAVNRALPIGAAFSLPPVKLTIPVPALPSLSGRWLVFEIGVADSSDDPDPGTTYVHLSPSLF
jgi:hypothetical protein